MSRAIDELIAQHLFGWHQHLYKNITGQMQPPHKPVRDGIEQVESVPRYTTDIDAAWQVVEKMKSIGWRVAIEDFVNRYRVNYSRGVTWEWRHNIEHVSVPLAICLAALRALNVELPKENA